MDSSAAKKKQKPISAFFGGTAKKDDAPKSSQKKISAFFGGPAKVAGTPVAAKDEAAKTAGAPAATPPPAGTTATPTARLSPDEGVKKAGSLADPLPVRERADAAQPGAVAAAPKVAQAPPDSSTSKPKAPKAAGAKEATKAGGKAKAPAKAAAAEGRRRLRRVVLEEEEGAAAGLEDGDEKQLEDSDYQEESASGSDDEYTAEEEDDADDAAGESDGDDNVGVGSKRKRPPTKVSGPAKKTPATARTKAVAPALATPPVARTPVGLLGTNRGDFMLNTPHPGTASKGPALATADGAGRSAVATPGTVAPGLGCASVGRSRGTPAAGLTPSSVRTGRNTLAETPSKSVVSEVTLGVAACTEGDASRFADRMAQRFPFLQPDNLMDANMRRTDNPEYDPRTLHIPPRWFKDYKVSEGQQQWWTFKSHHFDSVLLFKMGKFYEMFEMDAYVGVDILGLTFMKGDQPHAGFPEVKYADMAERLARAGYRVVVIEQTETPEMLAKRNEERKMQGKKMENVVARQKVAVLSRGTLVDAEMVASRPDASYVLAVAELPCEDATAATDGAGSGSGGVRIGLCAVDAASGQVLLGEFVDDEVRSSLRTQLTALQPQELVLPREPPSATTSHVLRNGLRDPRVNILRGRAGEWSAEKTYRVLCDLQYFTQSSVTKADDAQAAGDEMEVDEGAGSVRQPPELDPSKRWPQLLRRFVAEGVSSRPAALAALGGAVKFLQDCMLDRVVLPLGRFEELPALAPGQSAAGGDDGRASGPLYLSLNGAALENLEVLENAEGGAAGTLLSVLDHCATPFGRRRLRQWLCRPLGRIADIEERQDAVAELGDSLAEAAGQARKMLAGVSDLERAITRLHASTVDGAVGRDAANVILYEDAGKRKVAALTGALKDLRAAHGALAKLRGALEGGDGAGTFSSALLQRILVERCRPDDVAGALVELESATDWKEAAQTGRAVPEPGVDRQYDAAVEDLEAVECKLQEYLKEVRQRFGREVSLVSVNKDSHLLEVPEAVASRLGGEFHLVGNRKGYKRYTSNRLKGLVADHDRAVERKDVTLSSILARLVAKFVSHKALWMALVEAVADLDALMSLSAHAMSPPDGGPMCRPKLVPSRRVAAPAGEDAAQQQNGVTEKTSSCATFNASALRHPAGVGGRNNGAFVPNDVKLGGSAADSEGGEAAAPFILLSGPNMGGKSTLLRQVCLATILAQVGACVPAESLTLSPADAIFVRMGARDSIMTGQSTFFIELAETAAMLAKATSESLVALDELGRGTATLDGAAVAGAVLQHLASSTGCRGLFATHYHHLSDEHANDPRVAVMHMACAVEGAEEEGAAAAPSRQDGGEEVTFLYRLTKGACPKSYGTNVARLAGLPPKVVARAAEVSVQWDHGPQPSGCSEDGASPSDGELRSMLAAVRSGTSSSDVARLRELRDAAAKLVGTAA